MKFYILLDDNEFSPTPEISRVLLMRSWVSPAVEIQAIGS